MRSFVLFIVFVAFLAAPAHGQIEKPVPKPADKEVVGPFKPLLVPAYEGIGSVDLKKFSLRWGLDLARLRAMSDLIQKICDPTVEVSPRERKSTVRASLIGIKRTTEDLRVGDTLWMRIWVDKVEVDARIDLICLYPKPAADPAP